MRNCNSASRLPTQRWMPKPNDRCWRGRGRSDDGTFRVVDRVGVAVTGDIPHHDLVALFDLLAAEFCASSVAVRRMWIGVT